MKQINLVCLGVAVAFGFSSCALPPRATDGPTPRPLGSDLPAVRAPQLPPSKDEQGPVVENPTDVLALRRALALALMHNPELAAFSWEVRAREAQTLQAGLRPNPELTFELENFAGSGDLDGFDAPETTIWLGQLIELAGKRLKRRRVASLEQKLAGWDYEVRRIDVFAEVAQAFVEVLAAQKRVALAEQLLRIAEESLVAVEKQVRAGAASPVERTRAEVVAATSRVELQRADRELRALRSRLAVTWGSRTATFSRVQGDLQGVAPPPAVEVLVSRIGQNPDLARWVQEIELRQAVVGLEQARRIPDVMVAGGPRYFTETDDIALVFGLTVPLPVFDRNQGAVQAARSDLAKASYQRRAAELIVASALDVAYQQLQARFEEVTALRERILPQAQSAFEGVQSGYLRGLFRYVDVLDAQRTLFELRGRQLDGLEAYHLAVVEIERLTGEPLAPGPAEQSTP